MLLLLRTFGFVGAVVPKKESNELCCGGAPFLLLVLLAGGFLLLLWVVVVVLIAEEEGAMILAAEKARMFVCLFGGTRSVRGTTLRVLIVRLQYSLPVCGPPCCGLLRQIRVRRSRYSNETQDAARAGKWRGAHEFEMNWHGRRQAYCKVLLVQ